MNINYMRETSLALLTEALTVSYISSVSTEKKAEAEDSPILFFLSLAYVLNRRKNKSNGSCLQA